MRRILLPVLFAYLGASGVFADSTPTFFHYYPPRSVAESSSTWGALTPPASGTGIIVKDSSSSTVVREVTSSTLIVSNGDGVAGNVTVDKDGATSGDFSSGTGTAGATCTLGDIYYETDTALTTVCPNTDTPRTLVNAIATVLPNTGTVSTTAAQSGYIFTNTGDGDGSELDLLNDPTVGVNYSVVVTAAQTLTVAPAAGETLYLNAASCANVTSATVGAALSVVAVVGGAGGIWVASGAGWTCN